MSALREVSNLPSGRGVDPKLRHAGRLAAASNAHALAGGHVAINSSSSSSNVLTAYRTTASLAFSSQQSLTASQPGNENVYGTMTSTTSSSSSSATATVHVDAYDRDYGGGNYYKSNSNSGSGSCASTAAFASQPRASIARRRSPRWSEQHRDDPTYCSDLIQDISDMFIETERVAVRRFNEGVASFDSNTSSVHRYFASPHYLQYQPEINEKMRVILIDWLIDVHIKFKLHPETMHLAVNILDRYLSCVNIKFNSATYIPRAKLQLVGVCAMLIAAKYEEIWPPQVHECVHISANTYTRDEIVQMERHMCTALRFRLTVPTAYPFAMRLLTVLEGEDILGRGGSGSGSGGGLSRSCSRDHDGGSGSGHGRASSHANNNNGGSSGGERGARAASSPRTAEYELLCHATGFFMEHALLDYKCLQYTPSQVACASVFLALLTTRLKFGVATTSSTRVWSDVLQHHSKMDVADLRACALVILEFVNYVPTTKYQAVRRKYNSARHGEVSKCVMPSSLPVH